METETTKSVKNDRKDGKLMWELLPLPIIKRLVEVYDYGFKKYHKAHGWMDLPDGYERYKAAMLRHLVAHEEGEFKDPESGLYHIQHMAWNAVAMMYFAIMKKKNN